MLLRRGILLPLALLFCLTTAGQDNDSIAMPRQREGFVKLFERKFNQFFDFNSFDTTSISPNKFNYSFMLTHNILLEEYTISATQPTQQSLSLSPNPSYKVGAYVGWRWIFIGWSMSVSDIVGDRKPDDHTEFTLNLYSSKVGADFYYWKMNNNFQLNSLQGFSNEVTKANIGTEFSGLHSYITGLNIYYIFNNRHFSYPAAFSQSTNQRVNAGSFLAGVSLSRHQMSFDHTALSPDLQGEMVEPLKVSGIAYNDYSLHFGYAFNWVFAHDWLACLSAAPALAYKYSHVTSADLSSETATYQKLNIDLITRAAVVYNNSRYFAGCSWVGHTYDYRFGNFQMNNTMGTLQFYVGFNFGSKAKHHNRRLLRQQH